MAEHTLALAGSLTKHTCMYLSTHTHTHTLEASLAREQLGLLKGRKNSSLLRINGWRAKEVRGREGQQGRQLSQDEAKGT